MSQPEVALEAVTATVRGALADWLRKPHVAPWYPHPEENLAWAEEPPLGGSHAVIACNGRHVGYIRWQVVDRATLDSVGLTEVPANSIDVDILLAEAKYIGKGIGPAALNALADQLRAKVPSPPLIGLTTSVDNLRAQRAFVKAGFRFLCQYVPEGFGLCSLYVLPLEDKISAHAPTEA